MASAQPVECCLCVSCLIILQSFGRCDSYECHCFFFICNHCLHTILFLCSLHLLYLSDSLLAATTSFRVSSSIFVPACVLIAKQIYKLRCECCIKFNAIQWWTQVVSVGLRAVCCTSLHPSDCLRPTPR